MLTAGFCWKLTLTRQYTWLGLPDLAYQVLPWFEFQAREWHQGRFPLLDPNHWGGQSLIGQVQPGAAFPLNWALFWLPLRDGHIRNGFLTWYFIGGGSWPRCFVNDRAVHHLGPGDRAEPGAQSEQRGPARRKPSGGTSRFRTAFTPSIRCT